MSVAIVICFFLHGTGYSILSKNFYKLTDE